MSRFRGNGRSVCWTSRAVPSLLFNFAQEPWTNKEVRQAMAYAINREQNAFLTNGIGAVGTVYVSGADDNVPQLLDQETIDQLNHYTTSTWIKPPSR
ncbi:MAG: hypothetical protein U0703_06315 [Anaerolineae bacterium]